MKKNIIATLDDAMKMFDKSCKNSTQVISAINRYLLPSFGFHVSSSRMSKKELEEASLLAQTIKLNKLNRADLIDRTEKTFQHLDLPNSKCKYFRCRINYFISFLEEKQLINLNSDSIKASSIFKFHRKEIDNQNIEIIKRRENKTKIILSFDRDDYLDKSKKNYNEVDKELKRIEAELNGLTNYVTNDRKCRQTTVDTKVEQVKRLLGWIYLKENDLSKVSLSYLIKVIDVNINVFDFNEVDKYFLEKGKLEHQSKEAAKILINWLEDFFIGYRVNNSGTKGSYIESLILAVKYLYKDITDSQLDDDFGDIILVKYLRTYRVKLPKEAQELKNLYLEWNEVIKVRNRLKIEADLNYCFFTKKVNGKIRLEKEKRPKTAVATSLMKFLMLCFLTIIPPDRIRTIRELKIGKTLKYGLKKSCGFIDSKKLKNKKEAKYYIHLESKDFKTGDIYGEFWGELPNIHFEDGSTFYYYLNKWLNDGWRKEILKINNLSHDYVFLGVRNSKPLGANASSYIKNIFIGKTGLPLNPHRLRNIFCTYIDEIGVSPKERESIAFWMHHSEEIAKNVYTIKTLEQKLSPAFDFMDKIQKIEMQTNVR